ncbi:hypothetical protein [Pseudescherichia sp.]|uniref:hypothetical protein n=1 Tax=Pseudescherichia sp. TaxID=2055881 RepID=UPI00289FA333|nr:hypothetical protein [Pseudescherichia sp.]
MDKFEGTPGPWEVAGLCCDAVGTEFDSVWYKAICHRPERTGGKLTDEYNANMRLIAAAPELLEALQSLFIATLYGVRNSSAMNSALEKSQDAINKALGK